MNESFVSKLLIEYNKRQKTLYSNLTNAELPPKRSIIASAAGLKKFVMSISSTEKEYEENIAIVMDFLLEEIDSRRKLGIKIEDMPPDVRESLEG